MVSDKYEGCLFPVDPYTGKRILITGDSDIAGIGVRPSPLQSWLNESLP